MNGVDPWGLWRSAGHKYTSDVDIDPEATIYHIGWAKHRPALENEMEEAAKTCDNKKYLRNLHAWEDSFNPVHKSS